VISVCLLGGATLSSTQRGSAAVSKAAGSSASIPSWQKVFARNGVHAVIYQPQLKAWQKYRTMVADTAISVTETGENLSLALSPGTPTRSPTSPATQILLRKQDL
jgi:hypothetical protein